MLKVLAEALFFSYKGKASVYWMIWQMLAATKVVNSEASLASSFADLLEEAPARRMWCSWNLPHHVRTYCGAAVQTRQIL